MKFLDDRLQQLKQKGLLRQRRVIDSAQESQITYKEQSLINFSSNNYLGLANHQSAIEEITDKAKHYGFGSGASHLICGHQRPHDELEKALADFTQREAALTFSSGYMANLAILQSLVMKGDWVIADKLNHASLIDSVKLSQAESLRYPHCDLVFLEKRLDMASKKRSANQNVFVVTDSVFSMDGDIAPLKEIVQLCEKYQAILVVDDAHGFGVLGESGRGCIEQFNLNQNQLPILMATLGKAIGGYGAFVYTTAMPAVVASANLINLKTLQKNQQSIKKLKHNIDYFCSECKKTKISLVNSKTAIQPLLIGDNQSVIHIYEKLLEAGLLVGAIRPPTVPENTARLRITLSASHSEEQMDYLIAELKKQVVEIKWKNE